MRINSDEIEEVFYHEGGETLAQGARRGGGCHILENIQGQLGRVSLKMSLLWMDQMTLVGLGDLKCLFCPKLFYDF